MDTPLETRIRTNLLLLLRGRLDFVNFWQWLMPLQRSPEARGPARKLLYQIVGRLYEYENGDWTDEQLRELLVALLPAHMRQDAQPGRSLREPPFRVWVSYGSTRPAEINLKEQLR